MPKQRAVVVVLGVLLGAGVAAAQGPKAAPTVTDGGKRELSMSDHEFLNRAIMGDHGAIDLANLALQKSQNNKVKGAAQTMVTDHTEMLEQMKGVAQTVGWKVQDASGKAARSMETQLNGLSGAEFDKAFVADLITMHRQELRMYEAEAANAKLEPLMKVTGQQLPRIREHLQALETLQGSGL